jgi:hypothetical protein
VAPASHPGVPNLCVVDGGLNPTLLKYPTLSNSIPLSSSLLSSVRSNQVQVFLSGGVTIFGVLLLAFLIPILFTT